jgi:hypothetical protein
MIPNEMGRRAALIQKIRKEDENVLLVVQVIFFKNSLFLVEAN